jgi:DNA-binding LacI/PurR family transcriptional regulator
MSTRRPSIHDVAAAANVSITTVSHALSGKGRLPDGTRAHVLRTAERLGYAPNLTARGLATGHSMLLGIQASGFGPDTLVPNFAYMTDILNAASACALDHGYALVVLPPRAPVERIAQLGFDGATVIDPFGHETLLDAMRSQGGPLVTMGRIMSAAPELAWVDTDHQTATRLMLDHLWERGYRAPAILTGTRGLSYVESVLSAYREWCSVRSVPAQVIETSGDPTEVAGFKATREALQHGAGPVDAVYATLDLLAVGALSAAVEQGLEVPDEFGVAAITDSPLMRACRPAVTALDLQPGTIGRTAVETLVQLVENPETSPDGQLVSARLITRASTAKGGGPLQSSPRSTN